MCYSQPQTIAPQEKHTIGITQFSTRFIYTLTLQCQAHQELANEWNWLFNSNYHVDDFHPTLFVKDFVWSCHLFGLNSNHWSHFLDFISGPNYKRSRKTVHPVVILELYVFSTYPKYKPWKWVIVQLSLTNKMMLTKFSFYSILIFWKNMKIGCLIGVASSVGITMV